MIINRLAVARVRPPRKPGQLRIDKQRV